MMIFFVKKYIFYDTDQLFRFDIIFSISLPLEL